MARALLFLIFNRPDLTARVFARIKENRPEKLYVAADGPRATKEGETVQCELSRAATEKIDWPCEVQRLYRTENLGCKAAVSSAITWFFEHEPAGIILEDDCLPDPSFFRFADELLIRYADNERVMAISGDNFQQGQRRGDGSYFFSKYPHIWGWASWRRAWTNYDVTMGKWDQRRNLIADYIGDRHTTNYFSRIFDKVVSGHINTWDYQFVFCSLLNRGLTISPQGNLVSNIGFDERGSHLLSPDDPAANMPVVPMNFPLVHPDVVEADYSADWHTTRNVFGVGPQIIGRAIRKLRGLLKFQ
ncbi:MAG: glycosyltransferase family 2 protein [Verrucomicrobiota bacterium]